MNNLSIKNVNKLNYPYLIYTNKISFKGNYKFSKSELGTDAVYTNWDNPKLPDTNDKDDVKLTILHMNDNHGQTKPLMKLKSALIKLAENIKSPDKDFIRIHSGDFYMGKNPKELNFIVSLLNNLFDFVTIGNHDLDLGTKILENSLVKTKFNTLSSNLILPKNSNLEKVRGPRIIKINGHEYGLIGISPPDLKERSSKFTLFEGLDVLTENKTVEKIKEEVKELENKGINKIILPSHGSLKLDKKIAKSVDGIDIILGGHSHELLDPLETEESIVNSPNGDPVLLFQEGQNGEYFGVIDAVFNKNGIIKYAKAGQEKSDNFELDKKALKLENKIFGESPIIGNIADNYSASDIKTQENPIANFITDSMRKIANADIAIYPSFSLRNDFKKGNVTERDVWKAIPSSGLSVINITGQDIIDLLAAGAKTYTNPNKRPGIMHASGLKYTISKDASVTDIKLLKNNTYEEPINPKKIYRVAIDSYLLKAAEDFASVTGKKEIEIPDDINNCAKATIKNIQEYQKENKKITMKMDGRIEILAEDPNKGQKTPRASMTMEEAIYNDFKPKLTNTLKQLGPKLLKDPYKFLWTPENPTLGYCYLASELLYHYIVPNKEDYKPMIIKFDNGTTHWFLQNRHNGNILDLTEEQFSKLNSPIKLPYEKAKNTGFLTKEPSKNAQILAKLLGLSK
ncbi:MAG: hypothetical protein A2287_05845 [Candidatus Melainabacteria bacterium RIFOXYA12_FULL_32_12]|nr:MAG: hypothetical protein A2255_03835 [Candidatus Melainabacteria bacterium RIFOXYA2_FULL_32_9]OGI30917.1 MAG: hypothetical protein A2287_05845 [Candidatus Melainabacteria bacterium RIFOXYA12_FULL_32_12]